MNAVILAGGRIGDGESPKINKALLNFKGYPMIKYVINALKNSESIENIMVIGNTEELKKVIGNEVDVLVAEKESIIDNLLLATDHFGEDHHILISTCDIPLLKGSMITDFIEKANHETIELVYPIIEKDLCQKVFPDVKRTFVTLKDGSYTGGNLVLINPKAIDKIEKVARLMVENRKNPVKMSSILGLKFLFKLLVRQLTIKEIENHIEKRFNIRATALINQHPEIGNDVDRVEDIKVLEKYI
ncbi:nucleotidyltransferase family protein [Alkaliphilus transvaalensis]|uniref:nucleotidyltransferase family protein n=1 Tax=Alkaliphilus transvaalensis TaxID=114628 RepID=UPI00047AB4A8|nr:nucleotidyltransferase family protein [Alkaliphilus transvaalensis]